MADQRNTTAATKVEKELGRLKSNVAALAIALTANGIELAEGADPIQAAIGAIKSTSEVRAQLGTCTEELKTAHGFARELETRLNSQTPGTDAAELEELRKRVVEMTAEIGELEQDLADITEEKNRLANLLAQKGGAKPPADPEPDPAAANEGEPPIVEERATVARDVGPTFGRLSEPEIADLVALGRQFEVAFSTGQFEIVDFSLPPIVVPASDLHRVDSSRFVVAKAIQIRGASAAHRIHGAGLILEGEQVAYCAFDPPIVVHPGQDRKFDRALIFG